MGACGCGEIQYRRKIMGADGAAYLLGVYSSCHYCSGPVAFQIWRCEPEDWHLYDVEHIPDLTVDDVGLSSWALVDPVDVRAAMEKVITGHHSEDGIDDVMADILADEAFKDLRDVVKVDIYP